MQSAAVLRSALADTTPRQRTRRVDRLIGDQIIVLYYRLASVAAELLGG